MKDYIAVESNYGWVFYCNKMKGEGNFDPSGGTIYMPLASSMSTQGVFVKLTVGTAYYTALGADITLATIGKIRGAYATVFWINSIEQNKFSYTSTGNPVRPVREE